MNPSVRALVRCVDGPAVAEADGLGSAREQAAIAAAYASCGRRLTVFLQVSRVSIMSTASSIHEPITRGQPRLERTVKSVATRGLLECLIVSPRARERDLLSRAATSSGWASVVCSDADTARHIAGRIIVKLAFIDLENASADSSAGLQELAAELTRLGCPLLVVCGSDGNRQQEIWARQLGAWLYLPGMAGEEEMTQLCEEARNVVERAAVSAVR